MRPSALLAVLLAGAITVSACGSDDGTDDPAGPLKGGEEESTVPTSADPGPVAPLDVTVEVDEPLVADAPVTWRLLVTNTAAETVRIIFATGQRGEVVLLDDGEEVYRWSANQVFTQAFGEEVMEPGGQVTYTLSEPALSVAPGRYRLVAEVTGRPAPPPAERDIEVVAG